MVEVHAEPYGAYEIEVVDDNGASIFVGTVVPEMVELAFPAKR